MASKASILVQPTTPAQQGDGQSVIATVHMVFRAKLLQFGGSVMHGHFLKGCISGSDMRAASTHAGEVGGTQKLPSNIDDPLIPAKPLQASEDKEEIKEGWGVESVAPIFSVVAPVLGSAWERERSQNASVAP